MKIALDYDGTYTANRYLWDKFADVCQYHEVELFIVTMRYPHEEITADLPIIYTSRKAKKIYCEEKGIYFDIWIDDNPEWLFKNG